MPSQVSDPVQRGGPHLENPFHWNSIQIPSFHTCFASEFGIGCGFGGCFSFCFFSWRTTVVCLTRRVDAVDAWGVFGLLGSTSGAKPLEDETDSRDGLQPTSYTNYDIYIYIDIYIIYI